MAKMVYFLGQFFIGNFERVGNGYKSQNDLAAEAAEFEAVIEDLLK